jgi:hypothetical protein
MEKSTVVDLVETLADAEDTEPTNLDYKLQEHIPVGAIERLTKHENASWTLSFEVPDHEVTVTSEGSIFVNEKRTEIPA